MIDRRHLLAAGAAGLVASPVRAAEPPLGLGRPHTDFVQSQLAPGRVLGDNNSQPGVEGIALSYDAKGTRAVTVIFKYPKGWKMPRRHYVNSDQEFYVLDGSLEFDGVVYRKGDYAYLPAGYMHNVMKSDTGAAIINFYEGEHLAFYEDAPAGMYKPEKLIKHLSSDSLKWQPSTKNTNLSLGKEPIMKVLRQDAEKRESTWIQKVAADDATAKRQGAFHECVEEMFLLEGEVATPQGLMRPGAYAWRAPGQQRGPFGSRTGWTALFRTKGGSAKTALTVSAEPIKWNAPYAPNIPEAQKAWAMKDWDRSKLF